MSDTIFDVLSADVKTLQRLLQHGELTSVFIVEIYLTQIRKHDDYLHAMIQTTPTEHLLAAARSLDQERRDGKLRSSLHGIPIIIKDNIATHPNLHLGTTAGSLALLGSRPQMNAEIVGMLVTAGAIILGKSNLSELSNYRGLLLPSGWSAVGGQTQSAYVRGGLDPNDSKDGHSSPSGSSTGSAVAVSAGYAPVAIGTETDGSLVCPAGRAALYTIKPTIGLVPQAGIVPVSRNFDSAGPMTKTTEDLAIVLDVITGRQASESFTKHLSCSWNDISVGTLDPDPWKFPPDYVKPVEEATVQINAEIRAAYQKIKPLVKFMAENVPLVSVDALQYNGQNSEIIITRADLRTELNCYLEGLDESKVRNLQELIDFNFDHAEQELPLEHGNQDFLIAAQEQNLKPGEYEANFRHLREVSRNRGLDFIFQEYGVDVIFGPADSFLSSLATCSGYPIAGMPLSYLDYNGRPFGLAAIAAAHQDELLVKVMSAWEATFPPRRPPQLVE